MLAAMFATASAQSSPQLSPKTRPTKSREVIQVAELQQDAFALAKTAPAELIRLKAMSEFRALGDWKRVLKMKPLPGSLRPESAAPRRERAKRPAGKRDYIAQAAAQAAADAAAVEQPPAATQQAGDAS
jgi:hypothetical protein